MAFSKLTHWQWEATGIKEEKFLQVGSTRGSSENENEIVYINYLELWLKHRSFMHVCSSPSALRIKTKVFAMAQRASLSCPGSPFLPGPGTLIDCGRLNPHSGLCHRLLLHHVPPLPAKLPLSLARMANSYFSSSVQHSKASFTKLILS